MNCTTGHLVAPAFFKEMIEKMPEQARGFVEVKRDLTQIETLNMQIKLCSPCGCGSGKKFKFCCHNPSH